MRANSVVGLDQSRIGRTQRQIPALSPAKREIQMSTVIGRNTLHKIVFLDIHDQHDAAALSAAVSAFKRYHFVVEAVQTIKL